MQKMFTPAAILALIAGLLGGVLASALFTNLVPRSPKTLIRDFYLTENAVHVSPHTLRKGMDKGDSKYLLVDLRSAQEYENAHIAGAVSIPAYSDPNTSAYGDVDRIVNAFRALPQDRETVVYCYSIPCMTGRKIGQMLAEHGIYVKHLGIGWNEWRYAWNSWNHEGEWAKTNPQDYIASGKEPGRARTAPEGSAPCPISGEFGC